MPPETTATHFYHWMAKSLAEKVWHLNQNKISKIVEATTSTTQPKHQQLPFANFGENLILGLFFLNFDNFDLTLKKKKKNQSIRRARMCFEIDSFWNKRCFVSFRFDSYLLQKIIGLANQTFN